MVVAARSASARRSGCCVRGAASTPEPPPTRPHARPATTPPPRDAPSAAAGHRPDPADRATPPDVDPRPRARGRRSPSAPPPPELERPAPAAGRLHRLRARLARSNSTLGQGLLDAAVPRPPRRGDLGGGRGDAARRRRRRRRRRPSSSSGCAPGSRSTRSRTPTQVRGLLREELLAPGRPDARPRRWPSARRRRGRPSSWSSASTAPARPRPSASSPGCSSPRTATWCSARPTRSARRPPTSCRPGGSGSACRRCVRAARAPTRPSVAFDAVKRRHRRGRDVVLIDTAGRLQNKAGLMDELGKVKRVVEKQAPVDEVLLVLDATTGQNGMRQAQVFAEVVNVTGIVLTKLDGTAKGGIVVAVQRELGVPVKLVGLGEGPDDLAPFEPRRSSTRSSATDRPTRRSCRSRAGNTSRRPSGSRRRRAVGHCWTGGDQLLAAPGAQGGALGRQPLETWAGRTAVVRSSATCRGRSALRRRRPGSGRTTRCARRGTGCAGSTPRSDLPARPSLPWRMRGT